MSGAIREVHRQSDRAVRFEWGPTGAEAVAERASYAVVVDVLSFTTTLGIAVERGLTVLPYRWRDARAEEYARSRDAVLAVGRFEAGSLAPGPGTVSLSPAGMATLTEADAERLGRIVLPSPNGATIAYGLRETGATVIGGCLRNAVAVADWLAPRLADGATLAVVAAGERWPDGSLRPAVEDLWGAGAVLTACAEAGVIGLSAEATMAADAFRAVRDRLPAALAGCASGRELAVAGFGDDVVIAAEHAVSRVIPVLTGDAFVPAT